MFSLVAYMYIIAYSTTLKKIHFLTKIMKYICFACHMFSIQE